MSGAEPILIERTWNRRPPPVLMRYVFGLLVHGVAVPAKRMGESVPALDRWFTKWMHNRPLRKNSFEKEGFKGFTPGAQDVFVPTFAKSGTNWMMQIAVQLAYHGRAEFEHLHELVPWPDMRRLPYAIPLAKADHWKTAPERKRIIKSHLDFDDLPYSPEARYLCVIRDPKDILVSSYHFVGNTFGPAMYSLDNWFRLFVEERFMLGGSWPKNTASYWEASKRHSNVMINSFGEMKRDLRGTVERVAAFLGIQAPAGVIDRVTELSSFSYMKSVDHKFSMFQMDPWGVPNVMIREGKEGSGKTLLSEAQMREIDERFEARLKELGSDFPYREWFGKR